MLYSLATRADTDISVLHDRSPLFVLLSDGSLRNGFTVKAMNKQRVERHLSLTVEGLPGAELSIVGQTDAVLVIGPDDLRSFRVYVRAPRADLTSDSVPFAFILTDAGSKTTVHYQTMFRGPAQ